VVGAGYEGAFAAPEGGGAVVVRDPADLDERLARATVAVLGAGMMKFEAAHLGVPAALVAVADDQPAVGEPFGRTGAAAYLGDGRTIDPGRVASEVASLLADAPRRGEMSAAGRNAIDGRGAERIAAAVLALARRESPRPIR
jgi:spore coat polysaccharide biosynthesis predicted glycosyltransferase SpsG